jgi:hypothetical protein
MEWLLCTLHTHTQYWVPTLSSGCFFDVVKAFDTVPREMLFKVLARLRFPPTIIDPVRVFHESATLEVDLDDDGNTIIIKYVIGVKQGDKLAPVLFLCYIQAVLETLFPKFEAAGIEKLMFRSMQPKPAVDGEMAASACSLMVKPAVFHSSISNAPSLPRCVIVHTGNIAIVPPSAGPTSCPMPPSLFAPRVRSPTDWGPGTVQAQVAYKTTRVRLVRSPRCDCESSD